MQPPKIRATKHCQKRMSQRGITNEMIQLTVDHGAIDQDKYVLSKSGAQKLLEELRQQERALKKVIDKGGVTVLQEGDAAVTTYRVESVRH